MRLLLALDSIPTNQAGIGILDVQSARWEHVSVVPIDEPFGRRGFRGAHVHGDTLYAVNSAAVYRIGIRRDPAWSFPVEAVHRRPEWELGKRAAADLHDVVFSPARDRLFVANSFMDAVDELSVDGGLVKRHYLWDLCPQIAELALRRDADAVDLVHVNHLTECDGQLVLTLGNRNGTRTGAVMTFDGGNMLVTDLPFPHDGVFAHGKYYVSLSGSNELAVYDAATPAALNDATPSRRIAIEIRQPQWADSFQWVRGIAVTDSYVICGVTQWRKSAPGRAQIPPRLVILRREDLSVVGDLFLPAIDGFPSPAMFTVHVLDGHDDELSDAAWPVPSAPVPRPPARSRAMSVAAFVVPKGEGRTSAGTADGGLEVEVAVADKFYAKCSRGAFTAPPATSALSAEELARGATTEVRCTLEAGLTAHLWAIYYDATSRIGHDCHRLHDGRNALAHEVPAGAVSCRLAIRFDGTGRGVVSPLQIFEST